MLGCQTTKHTQEGLKRKSLGDIDVVRSNGRLCRKNELRTPMVQVTARKSQFGFIQSDRRINFSSIVDHPKSSIVFSYKQPYQACITPLDHTAAFNNIKKCLVGPLTLVHVYIALVLAISVWAARHHNKNMAEQSAASGHHNVVDLDSSNAQEEDSAKITLGGMCYAFKLSFLQQIALTSPQVVPPFTLTTSSARLNSKKKGRRNNKVYAVLVKSDEGLSISDECPSIHLPLEGGTVNLASCRRHLFLEWTEHAKNLMKACKREQAPLRMFDLKNLGLRLICCPDPRPKSWLNPESPIRLTHSLAEDDNMVASTLLMADCGWDLTRVKDIFGPVLVLSLNGHDLRLRRLRAFIRSYFGMTKDIGEDILVRGEQALDMTAGVNIFTMPENVVKAAHRQQTGEIPPTDLLSHYDGDEANRNLMGMLECAHCSAKDGTNFKLCLCSRCEMVFYCNVGCQQAHLSIHKKSCKNVHSKLRNTTLATVN